MKILVASLALMTLWQVSTAQTPPAVASAQKSPNKNLGVAGDAAFKAAKESERKGESVVMLKHAKQLVERYPGSPLALRCLADAYYYLDFFEEALAEVNKAIQIDPSDGVNLHDLGEILLAQGKSEEAFAAYRKAVKSNLEDPLSWIDLGRFYLSSGKKDLALQCAKKAEELYRAGRFNAHDGEISEVSIVGRIAEIYMENEHGAEAVPHLKKAIALEPENSELWVGLSNAYILQRMTAQAVSALQQASKLKPGDERLVDALKALTSPVPTAAATAPAVSQAPPQAAVPQAPPVARPPTATEQIQEMQALTELLRSLQQFQTPLQTPPPSDPLLEEVLRKRRHLP